MQREAGDAGLSTLLNEGIEQLGMAVTDAQRQKLLDYVALLGKWNAVYNLTAIRDPRQMLIQHILDSLAIIPSHAPHRVSVGARCRLRWWPAGDRHGDRLARIGKSR